MESQISVIKAVINDFFGENFVETNGKRHLVHGRQLGAYLMSVFTDLDIRDIGKNLGYKGPHCTHYAIREIKRKCREDVDAKRVVIGIETIVELALNKDDVAKKSLSETDFEYCSHFGCTNILTPQQKLMSTKCPSHIESPNLYSLIDKKISNENRPKNKRQDNNNNHTHRSRRTIHIALDTHV